MDPIHPDYSHPDPKVEAAFTRWLDTPMPQSGYKPRELITTTERNVAKQAFLAGHHAATQEAR